MRNWLIVRVLCALLVVAVAGACSGDDDIEDDVGGDDSGDDDYSGDSDNPDDDDMADDDDDPPPAPPLIPGPDDEGYDADLEALARQYDRAFHVFNAYGMDLNSDISVSLSRPDDRALIEHFVRETDGWDLEEYAGVSPLEIVDAWNPVAGLYAGVGTATDAYRYGVLRDTGYPEEEVEIAREHLRKALESWYIAADIPGVEGVIARGYLRLDIPGSGGSIEVTPLFDEYGNPLPPEKDNGTWRADNTPDGRYSNYYWVDSCSRDMFIGWAAGVAGAWEVIADDPTFDEELKDRLRTKAREMGLSLSVVRESGYDLEIHDADGRTTFHGYLNENNFDRIYLPFLPVKNGMYSAMALGCVAALQYVAQDDELGYYLNDVLIGSRQLHMIAADNQIGIDLGLKSNYSSYNMAFMGFWLAHRYIEDGVVRSMLKVGLDQKLYDDGKPRQPREIGYSLYDFIYAATMAGATAWDAMASDPDPVVVEQGLDTLRAFPVPPYWDYGRINCDEGEIESGECILDNGMEVEVLGYVGRNDDLVCDQPIPQEVRPPSNYHWRSNPYIPNGSGTGAEMLPGVDFRYSYWLGRWTR